MRVKPRAFLSKVSRCPRPVALDQIGETCPDFPKAADVRLARGGSKAPCARLRFLNCRGSRSAPLFSSAMKEMVTHPVRGRRAPVLPTGWVFQSCTWPMLSLGRFGPAGVCCPTRPSARQKANAVEHTGMRQHDALGLLHESRLFSQRQLPPCQHINIACSGFRIRQRIRRPFGCCCQKKIICGANENKKRPHATTSGITDCLPIKAPPGQNLKKNPPRPRKRAPPPEKKGRAVSSALYIGPLANSRDVTNTLSPAPQAVTARKKAGQSAKSMPATGPTAISAQARRCKRRPTAKTGMDRSPEYQPVHPPQNCQRSRKQRRHQRNGKAIIGKHRNGGTAADAD